MVGDKSMRELAARVEICELRYRYSRHVDDCQWDDWVQLFASDASCDYEGRPPLEGHEEIHEFGASVLDEEYWFTMHIPLLPVIDVNVKDGTATGSWYLVLWYARPDDGAGWRLGRYYDKYRCVDGEWKFANVETIMDAHSGDSFDVEMLADDHYEKDIVTYRSQ